MEQAVRTAIYEAVASEPLARTFDLKLVALDDGYSVVQMVYNPKRMDNIYARAHGGAIYALIDEAFETAGQTDGTIAVALNVNVTNVASPRPLQTLQACARLKTATKRTASYDISVTDADENTIATCQALAFKTGKPIPFLPQTD